IWKLDGVRRVLYRLSELIEALANERPVFVVEGEKDVDALAAVSVPATCNPHGAGKWRDEYAEHFKGATVYVLPDNDEPGRAHARQVAGSLKRVEATVKIVELPGLPPHGDVSDWLKSGGTAEQLYELANRSEVDETSARRGPRLLNRAAFVAGFVPPDYLVEGVLQRRFIYAITGRTGEGKTTVCLRIAAHVAEGLSLNGAEVSRGRVLYLA